jgi:hypothetical protein
MNKLLLFSATVEAATGVALIVFPSPVAQLLFGAELSGAAVAVARVAGIGLFSLGLACWPGKEPARSAPLAILTYNLLVTLFLLYLGLRNEWVGVLLWPATALHAILTILLARASLAARKAVESDNRAGK